MDIYGRIILNIDVDGRRRHYLWVLRLLLGILLVSMVLVLILILAMLLFRLEGAKIVSHIRQLTSKFLSRCMSNRFLIWARRLLLLIVFLVSVFYLVINTVAAEDGR